MTAGGSSGGEAPGESSGGEAPGESPSAGTPGESTTAGAPGAGDENRTESGLPFRSLYDEQSLAGFDPDASLGRPGEYPFTRGVYPSMYTGRPWTMRQYAGFGTAKESNERYKQLVANGTGGLSVAFDLPTQMGHDSDSAIAHGEVGKVGVAIDSIEDMRLLFDGLPLDEVSTSMTINAPAALLLLMYQLVAEENGIAGDKITGTIQNDVLKEYIARGTYIYPPQHSLRLITDIFAYCKAEVPRWNTISISGYHMAEAGATPAQEIAFTLADGIEYVRAAVRAGLDVDEFAARLSFFFVSRTTILEEVAKFRAARRIWASVMRDEFGATNPKSQMLRFHTQTAGVQLTAQQPEVNLVRVAIQGLAAVLGGTQSLHTNSYDEALALPSEKAARLALRTQQVIAYESDVTKTVDPFAGSYAIESLTDDVEAAARTLMDQVEDLGGAVAAIERGFQKNEIEKAAYRIARDIDTDERVVVGVNRFTVEEEEPYEPLRVDPTIEQQQAERLARLRADRDQHEVDKHLAAMTAAAEGTDNVLYPMKDALRAKATVGEVCNALRAVWGVYVPPDAF
jgi:methylmalonyl-CoA mutase N-terminal domain/subunit